MKKKTLKICVLNLFLKKHTKLTLLKIVLKMYICDRQNWPNSKWNSIFMVSLTHLISTIVFYLFDDKLMYRASIIDDL